MIAIHPLTLGGSSARADIARGTILSEQERRAHALKLWPIEGPKRYGSGEVGHYAMDGSAFYEWAQLRREWVRDYSDVIDAENSERFAWECRL